MDNFVDFTSQKAEPEVVICHNNDDVELALDPFADNGEPFPIKVEYVEPQFQEFDVNEVHLVQLNIKPDRSAESDHENDFDFGNNDLADSDSDENFSPFISSEQLEPNSTSSSAVDFEDEIKNIEDINHNPNVQCENLEFEAPKVKVEQINEVKATKTVKNTGLKLKKGKKGRPKSEESHECEHCGKEYQFASLLKVHVRTHLVNKGYNCPVEGCQKSFARADHYKQHINNVHKGEIIDGVIRKPTFEQKCEICGKIFYHSGNLRKHLTLHSGERPFSCDECGRTFALSQHLKSHLKLIHSDEKNFQCSICGRLFKTSGNYKKHMKVHSGERPFKCYCGKAFGQSSNYHAHMRVHLNDRPFKCDQCDKSFVQSINLTLHKRVHTGGNHFFEAFYLKICCFSCSIFVVFITFPQKNHSNAKYVKGLFVENLNVYPIKKCIMESNHSTVANAHANSLIKHI